MDIYTINNKFLKKEKMSDNNCNCGSDCNCGSNCNCSSDSNCSSDLAYYINQLVSILIGLFAVYISWNHSQGYFILSRIFFAFFAFIFGGLYILLSVIFRGNFLN